MMPVVHCSSSVFLRYPSSCAVKRESLNILLGTQSLREKVYRLCPLLHDLRFAGNADCGDYRFICLTNKDVTPQISLKNST